MRCHPVPRRPIDSENRPIRKSFRGCTTTVDPEQGFRSCIGILGLRKRYSAERLDAACAKALALGTRSYSSVAAILKNKQESKTAPQREADQPSLLHDNIRGPGYYH
jgi:hypothetical protein